MSDPSANPERLPPWLWPRAAYLHVPFCAHHCGYCDFAVATRPDLPVELYIDAVAAELATLGEPQPVRTVCLGGCTPTFLSPAQFDRRVCAVNRWRPLRRDCVEFSVESTPDTLDPERVRVLAGHGVTRVSVGVQSFHDRAL